MALPTPQADAIGAARQGTSCLGECRVLGLDRITTLQVQLAISCNGCEKVASVAFAAILLNKDYGWQEAMDTSLFLMGLLRPLNAFTHELQRRVLSPTCPELSPSLEGLKAVLDLQQ